MQLPDETISYHYQGLLQQPQEPWTSEAELRSQHFLRPERIKDVQQDLMQAKSQVAAEREAKPSPGSREPIEAGFINWPQNLLDDDRRRKTESELHRIKVIASRLAENADRVILLGQGGPHLLARVIFDALTTAYHNEKPSDDRLGAPRLYFEGDSADNDSLQELLELNQNLSVDPQLREERWGVVVVSRSQLPMESSLALRALQRDALDYYGLRSEWLPHLFVPVLGEKHPHRKTFAKLGVPEEGMLSWPPAVSEPYSAFTAAGLLPACLLGLDVTALLQGAASMTKRFLEEPFERNPVLQFAAVNALVTRDLKKPIRVLNTWSKKLGSLGLWYAHLVSDALGKRGHGPTVLNMLSSRDLVTRGQQHQEGTRDRVIINLYVKSPRSVPIDVQMDETNADQLNRYARKTLPDIMAASWEGMNRSYHQVARPTADLIVPTLSEHTLGQLLQMLMLATAVEARMLGVSPYSAPSRDAHHPHVHSILSAQE